jgi:DNA-binding PadR family transcriptional regulator
MIELNKEIMASSLAPIVLMLLRSQESYGYQIIQGLRDKTAGQLNIAEGTLYPILKKMESKKWIEGTWKKADSGRERRYYSITFKGKQELEQQYSQWNFINELIHKLWNQPISISNSLLMIILDRLVTREV